MYTLRSNASTETIVGLNMTQVQVSTTTQPIPVSVLVTAQTDYMAAMFTAATDSVANDRQFSRLQCEWNDF